MSCERFCRQISSDAKYLFLFCPKHCDQGLIVAIVSYFKVGNKKGPSIIINGVISSHMCPCILRHLIDCHPQTVSQQFSLARHLKHFKLGPKPGWLFVSRISYIVILYVREGNFYVFLCAYTLSATRSAQFIRRSITFVLMW